MCSYRNAHTRGLAIDFDSDILQTEESYYMKIGSGSLGGKVRTRVRYSMEMRPVRVR